MPQDAQVVEAWRIGQMRGSRLPRDAGESNSPATILGSRLKTTRFSRTVLPESGSGPSYPAEQLQVLVRLLLEEMFDDRD